MLWLQSTTLSRKTGRGGARERGMRGFNHGNMRAKEAFWLFHKVVKNTISCSEDLIMLDKDEY